MIQNPNRNPSIHRLHDRGFSLVISLLMMLLIGAVSIGLLTLSTVALRSSQRESAQMTAKANARLAMMVAIGELQKKLGPDQRVTAAAGTLDTTPASEAIEGVTSPDWVGVWATTTDATPNAAPLISRSKTNPGLSDARLGTRPAPLGFLVSGNPTTATTPRPAGSVTLMTSKSDPAREIWAPLVKTASSGSAKASGSYGYWVKDHSSSIPLALRDRTGNSSPSATSPADGGYAKLLSPASQTARVIPGFGSMPTPSDPRLANAVTMATAILTAADANAVESALDTDVSRSIGDVGHGVLADTLRGGLRANLTSFLSETNTTHPSDTTGPALSDSTPIIGGDGMARFSPKFGVLRDYWKLAEQVGGSFTKPEIETITAPLRADRYGPERQDRTRMQVAPIVTDYSVYLDYTYHPADKKFYLMVFPRITLYNPYNATIKARPHHVQITCRLFSRIFVPLRNLSTNAVEDRPFIYENYFDAATHDANFSPGGRPRDFCFYLEPTKLEPGEAIVFTPSMAQANTVIGGRSGLLSMPQSGNLNFNVLSAGVPPSDLTSYYFPISSMPAGFDLATPNNPTYKLGRLWENGFHFGYDFALGMRLRTASGSTSLLPSLNTIHQDWPVIQVIDSDNWFRSNNGRWRDNTDIFPLYQRDQFIGNYPPNPRTQFGMRLKWLQENQNTAGPYLARNWDAAVLANYDIRAAHSHRNPWDNITPVSNSNEFTYGQYAIETLAPSWLDPSIQPRLIGGKNRISPFFSNVDYQGNTFPLFDLPKKQLPPMNVGQLRHAHLSAFSFWPSFIIGESLASPSVRRDSTAWPDDDLADAWTKGTQQYTNKNCFWWEMEGGNKIAPRDFNCVFDVSYEVNHALWDSYFLTGLDGSESGWNGDTWTAGKAMPNPRLVPNPFQSKPVNKASMLGHRRAASSLVIDSPFNVNTTDKHAWASLLKSFRGINVPVRNGSGQLAASEQAFPRNLVPQRPGSQMLNSTDSNTWDSFQILSDEKIEKLAENLVVEVKRRGPFISISDFVNRRLVTGGSNPDAESDLSRTGLVGTLQAALDAPAAGINSHIKDFPLPKDISESRFPLVTDGAARESRGYGPHLPDGKAAFSGGYVSQGDVLAKIGSVLTARGDTFTIRAYGEALAADGVTVTARAWCEAMVQRVPDYLDSAGDLPETPTADLASPINRGFGRRFDLLTFRWLHPDEI